MVHQVADHLTRLGELLQMQSTSIQDINHRLDRVCVEVEELKKPNYDQIFAYIDRQVRSVRSSLTHTPSLSLCVCVCVCLCVIIYEYELSIRSNSELS